MPHRPRPPRRVGSPRHPARGGFPGTASGLRGGGRRKHPLAAPPRNPGRSQGESAEWNATPAPRAGPRCAWGLPCRRRTAPRPGACGPRNRNPGSTSRAPRRSPEKTQRDCPGGFPGTGNPGSGCPGPGGQDSRGPDGRRSTGRRPGTSVAARSRAPARAGPKAPPRPRPARAPPRPATPGTGGAGVARSPGAAAPVPAGSGALRRRTMSAWTPPSVQTLFASGRRDFRWAGTRSPDRSVAAALPPRTPALVRG